MEERESESLRAIAAAVAAIRRQSALRPAMAIVLGSGFNGVQEAVSAEVQFPYARLPGFPATGVAGHAGKLVLGWLSGSPVALLCGRAHYYEGCSLAQVTLPVRVMAALGAGTILLTNAAGAINPRLRPGDFMALTDHINLMGDSPLRGWRAGEARRFVDLVGLYDRALVRLLRRAARAAKARLRTGVYLCVAGPNFETPAEVRAFASLGADAVGMSTVPEAIVARQCGLKVAALSCITNVAAGRSGGPVSQAKVLAAGRRAGPAARRLICAFVRACAPASRPGPTKLGTDGCGAGSRPG